MNPNGQNVEIRTRADGFLSNQSYINISGFRMQAANITLFGNNNLINNCQILYPSTYTDPAGWTSPSASCFMANTTPYATRRSPTRLVTA